MDAASATAPLDRSASLVLSRFLRHRSKSSWQQRHLGHFYSRISQIGAELTQSSRGPSLHSTLVVDLVDLCYGGTAKDHSSLFGDNQLKPYRRNALIMYIFREA